MAEIYRLNNVFSKIQKNLKVMKNLLFVLLAVSILSSCVSKKKFVELETSKASLEAKYGNLKKTNQALQNENAIQLQNTNSLQSQIVQQVK